MKKETKNVLRVVGCFLEHNGRFLILHRNLHVPQGGTWGLVAGKVRDGERDSEAMMHKMVEEIGYTVKEDDLKFLGTYYLDSADYVVEFVTYQIELSDQITFQLNPEGHQAYKWVTPEQCYALPNIMPQLHDLLEQTGYIDPTTIS